MSAWQGFSMAICVAFGFAYLGWVAWSEGAGFWLVAAIMGSFAGLAWIAHRLMATSKGR